MKTEEYYFEDFSDAELYNLAMELQESTIPEDAGIRKCAKDIFGTVDLVRIIGLGVLLSKELAKRLKKYSPYFI